MPSLEETLNTLFRTASVGDVLSAARTALEQLAEEADNDCTREVAHLLEPALEYATDKGPALVLHLNLEPEGGLTLARSMLHINPSADEQLALKCALDALIQEAKDSGYRLVDQRTSDKLETDDLDFEEV